MTSPITYPVDNRDLLDDADLWAAIDSAAAASLSSTARNHHRSQYSSPPSVPISKSPRYRTPPLKPNKIRSLDGEVVQQPPLKIARSCVTETSSPMAMVKHMSRREVESTSPLSCMTFSPGADSAIARSPLSYGGSSVSNGGEDGRENNAMRHSLSGQFPSVSLFKEYQSAALAILEKSDYTLISGSPYIKKTGWRKISCYFNISYEIKDKSIEFDENRNVQRAEFVVRAYMHGGRFSDGWGSCDRREKRFVKPNNDVPSTAETRAKNKACQDLLGIGEYRPAASHAK